jgi:hypothetical protein
VREWGGKLVFPIPDSRGRGGLVKVVLFCGGHGMRMRDDVSDLDADPTGEPDHDPLQAAIAAIHGRE